MDKLDNVTIRKPKLTKSVSLEGINSSLNSTHSVDVMGMSLDLSTHHVLTSNMEDMKSEITSLRIHLDSTQNELENVILENNDLKKQISHLAQEVEILKQICRSPVSSLRKNNSSAKKSVKRRLVENFRNSPIKLHDDICTNDTGNISQTTSCSPAKEYPEVQSEQVLNNMEEPLKSAKSSSQESAGIRNTNINKKNIEIKENPKRLFLFGGRQCAGLSSSLRKSRVRRPYEHYQIVSFIKPNAKSVDILNCAKLFDITPEDRVLICVGQHDSNPLEVMTELCIYLKSAKCPVFVIKVFENVHLNVSKLNDMLIMISRQLKKSIYIDIDSSYHYSSFDICSKINSIVDQHDYNQKFLNFKQNVVLAGQTNNLHRRSYRSSNFKCETAKLHKYTQTELVTLSKEACTQTNSTDDNFFRT